MKQIFTSAKETVALTRNANSISLFAGATLGLAGTIVLNARDAAAIASELMVAALDLDAEAAGDVIAEYGERLHAAAAEEADRRSRHAILKHDGAAPLPPPNLEGAPGIAAVDITSDQMTIRVLSALTDETVAGLTNIANAAGLHLVVIDTLSSHLEDQTASDPDNKPASGQDGQPSSDKVSIPATSATGKTEDQTKAVEKALTQESKPASSEAPKPAAKRGRKPKASA